MAGEGFHLGDGFVRITAQDETAAGKMRAERNLRSLQDRRVRIDADISRLEADADRARRRIEQLGQQTATPEVELETRRATAQLAQFEARLRGMRGNRVDLDVDVDVARARVDEIDRRIKSLPRQQRIRIAADGADAAASAIGRIPGMLLLIPAAAAAAGAGIAALPGIAFAAASAIGVLGFAFAGIGAALQGYEQDQNAAAGASSAGASAARASARAIRDATEAIADAKRDQARVARDTAYAIQDAEQAVQDAVRESARAARDAARAVEDAQDDLADAQDDAARAATDAAAAVESASRRVAQAQRDERRAQEDLNDAREDALRQLAELEERTSDVALDQEGAAIALLEAEKRLAQVNDDVTSTDLDKRKAAYDVAVARERVSDLEREATETTEELTEAQAKGVEGSDEVVAAKDRLQQASDATADAERALAQAQTDAAQAQVDAAERVADAEQAVADAKTRQTEVAEDNARRVADAEQGLQRAREQAADAQQDAADRVADAMQQLADAQEDAAASAAAGAGAASAYAKAMAKLTPEGRAFVEQLLRIKELGKGLSDTAQRAFLPGLTQMLKDSEVLFPIFDKNIERTGTIMGDAARKMGELFQTKQFQDNLTTLLASTEPITGAIGDSFVAMTGKLVEFGARMSPVSAEFAGFIDDVTAGITEFLDILSRDQATVDAFASIWDSLGIIFRNLLPIIAELVAWFAEQLAPLLADFAQWLSDNRGTIDALVPVIGSLVLALGGLKILKTVMTWGSGIAGMFRGIGDAADDMGRRSDGAKGKLGKLLKIAGGGAALGVGAGIAGALAPGDAESGDTGGNLGVDDTANNLAGAAGAIGSGDFGSIFADIGAEIDQMTTKFQNGQAPIQGYWNDFNTWLGRLPADTKTWFGGFSGGAQQWLSTANENVNSETAKMWYGADANLGQLPGGGDSWFGGLAQKAGEWLGLTSQDADTQGWSIWDNINTALGGLPQKAVELFGGFRRGAGQEGEGAVGDTGGWLDRIVQTITGTSLFQSGVALISGFWDGLRRRWDQLVSWVQSSMAWLRGFWPFSPAQHGPFSGRGYVTYSGKALTGDFADSLAAGMPGIIESARNIMSGVQGEMGLPTSTAPAGSLGGGLPSTLPAGMAPLVDAASAGGSSTTIDVGGVTLQVQGILDFRSRDTATRQLVEELRAYLVEIEKSYS